MSLINRSTNSKKVSSTLRRMARGYIQMSGRVVRSPKNKEFYPAQWAVDYSEGGLFQSPLQVKVDYS